MSSEAQRQKWRDEKAAERAKLTPSQRADKRREHDENYRETHRVERQEYDAERQRRIKEGRWSFPRRAD